MARKFLSERPKYEKQRHLGSNDDFRVYAERYLDLRMWQIKKDMEICLRGARDPKNPKKYLHAYFPALLICCGTFELLANLYAGSANRSRKKRYERLYEYGKLMPHHCYGEDNIFVLFNSMRNMLAHTSTGGGLWKDEESSPLRKIVWRIDASNHYPALSINAEKGKLTRNSFRDCAFTHRLDIKLDRFRCDILESVYQRGGYKDQLLASKGLQKKFRNVMESIYPQ